MSVFESSFNRLKNELNDHYFDQLKEDMTAYGRSLPVLKTARFQIYDFLEQVHTRLKSVYSSLPFSSETSLAGPVGLSTFKYSTNDQKKVVHLILPDFSESHTAQKVIDTDQTQNEAVKPSVKKKPFLRSAKKLSPSFALSPIKSLAS